MDHHCGVAGEDLEALELERALALFVAQGNALEAQGRAHGEPPREGGKLGTVERRRERQLLGHGGGGESDERKRDER